MRTKDNLQALDLAVRAWIYSYFVENAGPPGPALAARHFELELSEAEAVYLRLHEGHFLFLEPGKAEIRMAHPLSAVETPFLTSIGGRNYWANCAWDMFGIAAMLEGDAGIEALTADTGEWVQVRVREGEVEAPNGAVVHFSLPASRWYEDLIET